MTRKKVKLAFISNDSSRKTTFNKRKKGLIKKVNELSTLCGINACAVIYSPYDSNPEVWPSPSGVQRVVSEFKMLPEMDQQKKMVDQATFLRQRIEKTSEHLKREMKEVREREMTEVMFQSLAGKMEKFPMNILDLNDLGYIIDQHLKDLNRRGEVLGNSGIEIGESSNAAVVDGGNGMMVARSATTAQTTTSIEMGSSSTFAPAPNFFNPIQQHQHQYQQQQFHPVAPHFGRYEQSQNLNHNQQQLFMETINHPEQRNYVEQMSLVMDNNHHNHQQQHHIPGESSTASVSVSTSTTIPVTNPNITNNIWFR